MPSLYHKSPFLDRGSISIERERNSKQFTHQMMSLASVIYIKTTLG